MRDMRDPHELGFRYRYLRDGGSTIEKAVSIPSPPYRDGPFISSNPAEHHSKTPQTLGDLTE